MKKIIILLLASLFMVSCTGDPAEDPSASMHNTGTPTETTGTKGEATDLNSTSRLSRDTEQTISTEEIVTGTTYDRPWIPERGVYLECTEHCYLFHGYLPHMLIESLPDGRDYLDGRIVKYVWDVKTHCQLTVWNKKFTYDYYGITKEMLLDEYYGYQNGYIKSTPQDYQPCYLDEIDIFFSGDDELIEYYFSKEGWEERRNNEFCGFLNYDHFKIEYILLYDRYFSNLCTNTMEWLNKYEMLLPQREEYVSVSGAPDYFEFMTIPLSLKVCNISKDQAMEIHEATLKKINEEFFDGWKIEVELDFDRLYNELDTLAELIGTEGYRYTVNVNDLIRTAEVIKE